MNTIDVATEAVPQTQAVAKIEKVETNGITPAQAKVEAVAKLTMSAYEKASELRLTKEETDALQAIFPDEAFQPGAAGKEHLIYIEHAHLRDRFNSVFGMGQWSIVPRNRWAEPFKTAQNKEGSRVYVEAMLVVRGCFVAEAVGAMEYYPHNAGQDYSDAVEGAKTAALRRCAKELGVGLQAWKKEFCEGWWKRRKNPNARPPQNNLGASGPTREAKTPSSREDRAQTNSQASLRPASNIGRDGNHPETAGTAKPAKQPVYATAQSRMKFLHELNAAPGESGQEMMKSFCVAAGMLLETESNIDLPLRYVPVWKNQVQLWKAAIDDFESGGEAVKPFVNEENLDLAGCQPSEARDASEPRYKRGSESPANNEPGVSGQKSSEWFMEVVCPVPRKGMKRDEYLKNPDTIGSMFDARHGEDEESAYLRGRLFGFLNKFVPEGWTKRDGTKMPPNKEDIAFREALDALGDYLESKGEKI